MKISQKYWSDRKGWVSKTNNDLLDSAQLVFVFGGRSELEESDRYDELKDFYPNADIVIGSTAGEIMDTHVVDNHIIATAVSFEKSTFKTAKINISEAQDSFSVGKTLGKSLDSKGLLYVFILSDGQIVNGSDLLEGLTQVIHKDVPITGGLAGDGPNFQKTLVGLNSAPVEGEIVIVGFYGESLTIGHGSKGGWDPFGPERLVTKSDKNVLYELDGQNALDLYKKYLGEQASELPGSALLFPLSIWGKDIEVPVVRTVLKIDEENKSMTFAGNLPVGSRARLMKANFDRLIDGAITASNDTFERINTSSSSPELAILISCVGRKLVLNQRIEEETEGVRDVLGDKPILCGFYSYGELSPFVPNAKCELHNQTMTITTLSEA